MAKGADPQRFAGRARIIRIIRKRSLNVYKYKCTFKNICQAKLDELIWFLSPLYDALEMTWEQSPAANIPKSFPRSPKFSFSFLVLFKNTDKVLYFLVEGGCTQETNSYRSNDFIS